MLRALLIGGFGFIGTLSRYYLQGFAQRLTQGTFPYGALAVNVLGSLVQVNTYRPGKEPSKT